MTPIVAAIAAIALVLALLALVHRPLGDYMAYVFTTDRDLAVERWLYRLVGVDSRAEQRAGTYARSVLVFSAASILLLYLLQRVQSWLPFSLGFDPVAPDQAWNTAVSFVTNTNWQSYSGESTMGYVVQAGGLAVQNFLSAAVGIAVAIALVRGFARVKTGTIGNFWVDLTRGTIRILLPIATVGAIVLLLGGVIQNFADPVTVTTIAGGTQTIPGGPVASQEVIKLLGTNGGGFFNANSAHPFENPQGWTNLFEIFLILLIPSALPRTFGTMTGSRRDGNAILAAMSVIFVIMLVSVTAIELMNPDSALSQAGAALEGKELRLGVANSAFFATATTGTSTGAVDSFHSSYSALSGGVLILNMLLGEVAPGGVGSGLYGILVLAIIAVFIAGLMVGRTPEYLGKKIGPREMRLAAAYLLVVPVVVLVGTAVAFLWPGARESLLNGGPHGLSEVLYAFASAGNNNGSAFAGLNANTGFFNVALAFAMLANRFVGIVLVLLLAGALAEQQRVPATSGSFSTTKPLFVGLVVGVTYLVSALTFLPALALGPIAEGLS